jgi:acetylglutamate kinase
MDAGRRVLPVLTAADGVRLIASGAATGGMQAKLEAAAAALRAGVEEVRIAPGAEDGVIARLLAGEDLGTRMVPSEVTAR